MAWQFDRPDTGEGVVQAFRRPACPEESLTVRLRGLEPKATYELMDDDGGAPREVSGAELLADVSVRAPAAPAAVLSPTALRQGGTGRRGHPLNRSTLGDAAPSKRREGLPEQGRFWPIPDIFIGWKEPGTEWIRLREVLLARNPRWLPGRTARRRERAGPIPRGDFVRGHPASGIPAEEVLSRNGCSTRRDCSC
ncbi:MAG: GH36 C-terminal domain-containing protein [Planctomycetota bacterium]